MNRRSEISDEDASYYAESMTDVQRELLSLCDLRQSLGYRNVIRKDGFNISGD